MVQITKALGVAALVFGTAMINGVTLSENGIKVSEIIGSNEIIDSNEANRLINTDRKLNNVETTEEKASIIDSLFKELDLSTMEADLNLLFGGVEFDLMIEEMIPKEYQQLEGETEEQYKARMEKLMEEEKQEYKESLSEEELKQFENAEDLFKEIEAEDLFKGIEQLIPGLVNLSDEDTKTLAKKVEEMFGILQDLESEDQLENLEEIIEEEIEEKSQ